MAVAGAPVAGGCGCGCSWIWVVLVLFILLAIVFRGGIGIY